MEPVLIKNISLIAPSVIFYQFYTVKSENQVPIIKHRSLIGKNYIKISSRIIVTMISRIETNWKLYRRGKENKNSKVSFKSKV